VDWLLDPNAWIGLVTLTALEIVLGIDNIVFISILSSKLPREVQPTARRLGLALAMGSRILLLLSLSFLMRLSQPLFSVLDIAFSGRDLVLLAGGLFLLAKSTWEIHDKLEGVEGHTAARVAPSLASVLLQIALLDVVFSLDSVITAVGMVNQIPVMVTAIVIAVLIMMLFAEPVSAFVEGHPTIKMLALSFLLLIGMVLVAEGLHQHISKGYIYFAMAFSLGVEMLNLRLRPPAPEPVHLRTGYTPPEPPPPRPPRRGGG
jgi:predicted tellurium resistance membrane protein TerC